MASSEGSDDFFKNVVRGVRFKFQNLRPPILFYFLHELCNTPLLLIIIMVFDSWRKMPSSFHLFEISSFRPFFSDLVEGHAARAAALI